MKIIAIIGNVFLFLFTCFILVTDGFPKKAIYIVFTVWSLLTMILSTVVISRIRNNPTSISAVLKIMTIICNIVFLICVCWAIIDQYPHPEEEGVVFYTVLMVIIPILNFVVLSCSVATCYLRDSHLKRETSKE